MTFHGSKIQFVNSVKHQRKWQFLSTYYKGPFTTPETKNSECISVKICTNIHKQVFSKYCNFVENSWTLRCFFLLKHLGQQMATSIS